jgi:hypothetical protein
MKSLTFYVYNCLHGNVPVPSSHQWKETMELNIKKSRKLSNAQGIVEFALALPFLLLLMFGIIEGGRLLFLYSAVHSASREAVRYGSASGEVTGLTPYYIDCAGIQAAAMRIGRFAGVSAADVTISYDNGPGTSFFGNCPLPSGDDLNLGDRIVVDVVTTWQPLLPLVNFTSFPITAQSSRTIIKDVPIEGTPPPPFLPTIAFVLDDQTVDEGDGDINVILQLSAAYPLTVSVPFSVSGTAVNGDDFSVTPSPINLPPGDTIAKIVVSLNDDNIDEPAETVVLTMGMPANAIKGTPSIHTITVQDNDDPPKVSFVKSAQSQTEDLDALAVLQLSNPSVWDLTVDYGVAGTALDGVDYTVTASPIVIPAMTTNFPIVVDIIDDLIDEDDETVDISILNVVNGSIGSPGDHTLTILDNDDPPEVFFTWPDQSVKEDTGDIGVEVQLSIESSKDVTVDFTLGGTAHHGNDYLINPSSIVIPAGDLTFSIPIKIDHEGPPDTEAETIVLTLVNPDNATLGSPKVHTITIEGPPPIPNVSFETASQSSADAVAGKLVVWVVLDGPYPADVVVPYSLSGTAKIDIDYTIDASPLTISAGGGQSKIEITLIDDGLDEDDETIVISMGTVTNANKVSPSVHTITITDNDPEPQLFLTSSGQTVAEDVGTVTITAQLSAISGRDVTVPFSLSGSAALGVSFDYTITASPVTIPAGSSSVDISLDVKDDDLREPDEDVILTLDPPINATLGTPIQFTLTIQDNEPKNCPYSIGQPYFGVTSDKNFLSLDIQSEDPLIPVNLVEVRLQWPVDANTNVTSIIFGTTIYAGDASPPLLVVNTPNPLWSGTFTTHQLTYMLKVNPQSVPGDFYLLSATFEGCPPVTATITSD